MTTPQPYYLEHPTPAQLAEIYQLRVAAWKQNPHFDASKYPDGIFDSLDPIAHHWVIEDEDRIVAAARVVVVNQLTDIPNWQLFNLCELPKVSPLAYLSRLVILPMYQGRGWSGLFDRIRLAFIDEANIPCTICYCYSESNRIKILEKFGFTIVGFVNGSYNFYKSDAYVQLRVRQNAYEMVCQKTKNDV